MDLISDTTEKTFIELFAGIGLIHEALRQLGWKAVFANDNSAKKASAYAANYPEVPFNLSDVSVLDPIEWPLVKLITASFPCVDLSQAGNRHGIEGAKSSLVRVFLDKINRLIATGRKPEFLLIENVPNLLSIHGGTAIDEILDSLTQMGYGFDVLQLDAKHFTPQSRNRVFIVAVDLALYPVKSLSLPDDSLHRHKVRDAYKRNSTLPWIFFDLPPLPHRVISLRDIIEDIPPDDPRWWNSSQTEYFWELLELDHKVRLQQLIENNSSHVFSAVRRLRRRRKREQIFNLRFDGLASCLRTPGGGSSTQYVVFVEGGEIRGRKITPLESARLQGVCLPNSISKFSLVGSDTDIRFAFGDAVCVPAVRWVVQHTVDALMAEKCAAEIPIRKSQQFLALT